MADGLPFIPGELDDAGLTVAQFRVFARIARRGVCSESVPNMAKGCRLNEDTIWDALRSLLERGMLSKMARPGQATLYTIKPIERWPQPTGKEGVPEKRGCPSVSGDTHRKRGGAHPPEKRGHKVTPIEVTPSKVARFTPPTLEMLKLQAAKIALPEVEAEKFWNHYESNGWKVGRNPMRSWHAALTNWHTNWRTGTYANNHTANKPNPRNAGLRTDPTRQGIEAAEIIARRNGTPVPKPMAAQTPSA